MNFPDFCLLIPYYRWLFCNKVVRNSISGRELKLMLKSLKKSSVGNVAPDFDIDFLKSTAKSLSSFQNKDYVLLDSWASWCVPCRADIPSLKNGYKTNNKKGFAIIGISRDEKASQWKKAIFEESTQM